MTSRPLAPTKSGAPSSLTPEITKIICDRVAEGESIRAVCRDPTMPGRLTVYGWEQSSDTFRAALARAKRLYAEHLAYSSGEELQIDDDQLTDLGRAANAAVSARKNRSEWAKSMAGLLDRESWGPRQTLDINAKIATMGAFPDMREETAINGSAEVIIPALPHVVTEPDP